MTGRDWDTRQRALALLKAYGWAKAGNFIQCQHWLDRADAFAPVSEKQVAYAQRLYDQARKSKVLNDAAGNPSTGPVAAD